MKQLLKKFRDDIFGVLGLSGALFLILAQISYDRFDPSFNSFTNFGKTNNMCGYLGSFISDLNFQLFGLGAWLVCAGLALYGLEKIFRPKAEVKLFKFALYSSGLLVVVALLSLHLGEIRFFKSFSVGGILGSLLTSALVSALNQAGAALFLWSVFALLVVVYSEKSIKELARLVSEKTFLRLKWAPFSLHTNRKLALAGEEIKSGLTLFVLPKAIKEELPPQNDLGLKRVYNLQTAEVKPITAIQYPEREKTSEEPIIQENNWAEKKSNFTSTKRPKKIDHWIMPKLNLLEDPPQMRIRVDKEELKRKAEILTDKLKRFNVEGLVVAVKPGPAVTMFEFRPSADVKLSNITSLENDLAIALSSESLRIIAPIPGRDVVGIESSNSTRETVYLKDLLGEASFWKEDVFLPVPLGRQANGDPQVVDLRKMPHLLVAGSTGSGKSVFTVGTITGLLFKHSPQSLRMILIDPKQVDLAAFSKIPHLLMPPIVEVPKAVAALRWAVKEMEKRYRSMSKFGSRGLESYNEEVKKLNLEQIAEHEQINQKMDEDKKQKGNKYYYSHLPYIVIVVEEFGDLMQVDKNNVEQYVVRLAQLARACGIHLILAMQSPRKEVVTGLIKTNIPGRISFKVASKMDSRIILDEMGAERLLARGDMLFRAPGTDKPTRHHGPWIPDSEINKVANFWSDQAEPDYDPIAMKALEVMSADSSNMGNGETVSGEGDYEMDEADSDDMYDTVVEYAASIKEISASLLQRRFKLGYPRAARLIEIMEKQGVVGPSNGSKPRLVLVNTLK